MIRLHKIDPLRYTPFDQNFVKKDFDFLLQQGICFTLNKKDADIFIGSKASTVEKFIIKNPRPKKVLLWTNEPRFSIITEASYRPYPLLPKIDVMNIYTGDVLIDNVSYLNKRRFLGREKLTVLSSGFKLKDRGVVALMSFFNGGKNSQLLIRGENCDLIKLRSQLALEGQKNAVLTVLGKGWPPGISIEDSRSGNWGSRKQEVLEKYNFNLCFENTVWPNYITEKIWDSIENLALPIYYGGGKSSAYEIFPAKSFLDYCEFRDPDHLYQYIADMTDKEFRERMNKCIEVYNSYVDKREDYWEEKRRKYLNVYIKRIREIFKRI